MKLDVVAENVLEALALSTGVVPTPLGTTTLAMLLARAIMAATKLGVFEVLSSESCSASDVAMHCKLDPHATEALLLTLVGAGYLHIQGTHYALTPVARRWLLSCSPQSLYDYMAFNALNWRWSESLEQLLQTGEPIHVHQELTPDEWQLYQKGMRALARFSAPEVARRIALPRGARSMLDIGGSHGYYAVMFCRLHPKLRAVVLDLPEAVAHAAPLLMQEGMGERVVHRAGNALVDDLGHEDYDLIFIGNLLHHLHKQENKELIQRCASALRPGGLLVIEEFHRPSFTKQVKEVDALFHLYFTAISEGGIWSAEEIAAWQREAGLILRKPIRLLTAPGVWLHVGRRN
jgi:SAM-dependent methyltransferase